MPEQLIRSTRLPPRLAAWLQAALVLAVCVTTVSAAFATVLGGGA
jgi:hypothetical protein